MNDLQRRIIESLYLEMHDQLLSYAIANLSSLSLAEEAVQETFRIACQKPSALIESPNPHGWLVIVLKNTINNTKRRQEYAKQLLTKYLATQTTDSTFSVDSLNLEIIYENIADLEEFKLIKEIAVEGKSYLEAANARGISLQACKKRIQRAKETLRRKIK